ncbi:MAG TPA: hypothetical protein VLD61_02840 [Methylomirabilota bacterium]|nr:hypothetical protein [Methylomirabilota bacterium]
MTDGSGPDVVGYFREGLLVLRRYPMLIVPPLAVQVIVFVLTVLLLGGGLGIGMIFGGILGGLPGGSVAGLAGLIAGAILLTLLSFLLSLIASSLVVVMAREALAAREPTIGPALDAVMSRFLDVVLISILLVVIIGLGMLFLVLPGLVAAFFLVFALPAVLLDGSRATEALGRSARLVRANLGPVAGFFVGGLLAAVASAILSTILEVVPLLGHLAAAVLAGVFISYVTVVGVRVFQSLSRP